MARRVELTSFDHDLTRREILRRAGYASVGAFLAACSQGTSSSSPSGSSASGSSPSPSQQPEEDKVVIVGAFGGPFGDAQRKYHFDPFTAATGIRVVVVGEPDLARLKAMVDSGTTSWDVAQFTQAEMNTAQGQGLLTKIDYSKISQDVQAGIIPSVKNDYGVGCVAYSQNLGYNTKSFPGGTGPKTWADFWNTSKFPGPRSFAGMDTDLRPLECALIADGVAPNQLYPMDIDRGYRSLAKIKPSVRQWILQGAALVASGEVVMSISASGRWFSYKDQGAPVDFLWDQALLYADDWVIPKGAKHPNNAYRFIEFTARAENQAVFFANYPNGPINKDAYKFLSDDQAARLPTSPANAAKGVVVNVDWWSQKDSSGKTNYDIVGARWPAFIAAP